MQAVGVRRESGPVLNVLLCFVIITCVVGGGCLALGWKIGGNFSEVSTVGSSFWWGGLALLLLGLFYIPCHCLVKSGSDSGRGLFICWTFLIVLGVLVILASAGISIYVYTLVKVVNPDTCVYVNGDGKWSDSSLKCKVECALELGSKFGEVPNKICCCCENDYDGIIYATDVGSCSVFKDSISLAAPLAFLYIASLILVFIDMVLAYVVACGCCDVITPWISQQPMVSTTNVVMTNARMSSSTRATGGFGYKHMTEPI